MDRKKEFTKNTFIIMIGIIFTKFISYLLLPLYKRKLSTAEYGTYELLNNLIFLIVPIISFNIDQGIFRYLINNRKNEKKIKEYISATLFFNLLVIIFSSIIFIVINSFINFEYKVLLVINIILSDLSTIVLQISRGLGKNKEYSKTSIITAMITIIFNIVFLLALKMKVNGLLIGGLIGYLCGILYISIKLDLLKYISFKVVKKKNILELLKYSAPLIPNSLSWWVFSVSDRFVVSYFLNLSATGLLSISYKISNIVTVIYSIFNMSLTEFVSLHIKEKNIKDIFNNLFNKIIQLFTSLGFLILVFMPILFKLFINDTFIEAYKYIPIAIIACIFHVIVGLLGVVYVANKNTKSISKTSIASAIINIITNIILIKYIGIYAAVVSTLISYMVLFIYRYIDVRKKYFKASLDWKKMILNIIIGIIVCIVYYQKNVYVKCASMIIITIYSIYMNKETIKYLLNILRLKIGKGEQKNA